MAVAVTAAAAGFVMRGQVTGPVAGDRLSASASIVPDDPSHGLPPAAVTPPGHQTEVAFPAHIRWIAAGGGGDPSYNEVSLEQDLALAREVFGSAGGVLLHAGGTGVDGVRIRDDRPRQLADPAGGDAQLALRARLAELLDPRDRAVRYRPSELEGAGPATRELLTEALVAGINEASPEPLLFFFSGHGEQGDEARYNTVHTWGGRGVSPADVAELLDEARPTRPVVFVIAACFSGGFADIASSGFDADAAEAPAGRCGVFASTWDRESAGCDPDPDRGAQGGYSMHFLNALRGRDAAGAALPIGRLDYDGDGHISILDAHTRARIASTSIDVPTTTSEAWLRQASSDAPAARRVVDPTLPTLPTLPTPPILPEEQAVIVALGARFGLTTQEAVEARLDVLEGRLDVAAERLDLLDEDMNDAWGQARIALLERWPALDDPYHRDYAPTLAASAGAIGRWFDESPEARAWAHAQRALDAEGDYLELEAQHAALLRLDRAWQTAGLAARLRGEGGHRWRAFEALRSCERSLPPTP